MQTRPFNRACAPVEGAQTLIRFAFDEAIGFGWNDGCDAAFFQGLDQGVRIIGLVCEKGFRLDLFEQRSGLTEIGCVAGRERHGNGVSESIHDHMDLGCQTTSGSADGLIAAVFFAPRHYADGRAR